jgi:hypothetical protein
MRRTVSRLTPTAFLISVSPPSAPDQPPPSRPLRLFQLGGQPGHIRLEPPRSAIDYGPQFIEHDGDVSRHADLIGCGRAGLSLLDGALDVNGGDMAAGRPGRIRQAPDGPHRTG